MNPNPRKLAFLGTGNMAEALIRGLLKAKTAAPHDIMATARRAERAQEIAQAFGVRTTLDNLEACRDADVVMLCVKPQALDKLLVQIAPAIDARKLVISVAAGVPIAALERKLGAGARIVRAMPNTPALVGLGACAISRGEHATEEDLQVASS